MVFNDVPSQTFETILLPFRESTLHTRALAFLSAIPILQLKAIPAGKAVVWGVTFKAVLCTSEALGFSKVLPGTTCFT
jgi:hypothetical protein